MNQHDLVINSCQDKSITLLSHGFVWPYHIFLFGSSVRATVCAVYPLTPEHEHCDTSNPLHFCNPYLSAISAQFFFCYETVLTSCSLVLVVTHYTMLLSYQNTRNCCSFLFRKIQGPKTPPEEETELRNWKVHRPGNKL